LRARRSLEALSCAIEGLVVPRWRTESGLECCHLVVMRGGLYSASVGVVFSDEARPRGHKRERAQLRTAIATLIKCYPGCYRDCVTASFDPVFRAPGAIAAIRTFRQSDAAVSHRISVIDMRGQPIPIGLR